jgi:RimJ/RimL family protein N-acetyltransferase
MIEPDHQRKGFGLVFIAGLLRLLNDQRGTLVLDCWAGSTKLRKFYESAGFLHQGDFPKDGYEIAVFLQELGQ